MPRSEFRKVSDLMDGWMDANVGDFVGEGDLKGKIKTRSRVAAIHQRNHLASGRERLDENLMKRVVDDLLCFILSDAASVQREEIERERERDSRQQKDSRKGESFRPFHRLHRRSCRRLGCESRGVRSVRFFASGEGKNERKRRETDLPCPE